MGLHGFFIHPHTALYVTLEWINLSQSASDAICNPPGLGASQSTASILFKWDYSGVEVASRVRKVSIQVSLSATQAWAHDPIAVLIYTNATVLQCNVASRTKQIEQQKGDAHLLGIFLLTSPLFLSVTYKVSLNTQQDRTLLYRFSPVENSWPLLTSDLSNYLLLLLDENLKRNSTPTDDLECKISFPLSVCQHYRVVNVSDIFPHLLLRRQIIRDRKS